MNPLAGQPILTLGHEQISQTLERYVAALNDAGGARYVLAVELALGLARDGYITDLKFRLADRRESFQAFHSAVEVHASRAAQDSQVSLEVDDDAQGDARLARSG